MPTSRKAPETVKDRRTWDLLQELDEHGAAIEALPAPAQPVTVVREKAQ